MIKFLKKEWHALLYDEQAARRVTRGLFIGFGAMSLTVVPLLPLPWNVALAMGGGLLACLGGLIGVGEKNPTPEAVADAVKTVEARRSAGVVDPPPVSMPPGNPSPPSMTPGNP